MEKMVKHLFHTYGQVRDNPLQGQDGQPDQIVVEAVARLGEVVDITRPYDLQRGEELGAYFTDEERKAIEEGTYNGADAPAVAEARLQMHQTASVQPLEDEGVVDVSNMSAEELADYIVENNLKVDETVALAGDGEDIDLVDKVLDAEALAMQQKDADPRKGVVDALEAKSAQA